MANHPDPNNHPEQPDDPNKNPPTSDTNLGATADQHAAEPTSSDSFIDLGIPGGPADPFASPPPMNANDSSDISIVEWAALVEEAPKSDTAAEPPKFDRPSDQDWAAEVAHEVEPTVVDPIVPGRPPTDHAVDISGMLADSTALMADAPSQTGAADVAPPQPPHEPAPDLPGLSDEDSEEQDALAADLEVVRQTFNLDELDSQKKLTPPSGVSGTMPTPVNLAPDDEDVFEEVNRPRETGGSGSFSSSGVDLQQLDHGSFESIVDEVAAQAAAPSEPASSVDLGSAELPKAPRSLDHDEADQPPSGRDLIAEAVESGMDMHQPLMEVVDEEEALEANEVVESSGKMKQPLMDIADGEEALEASEVVESSGKMKQPLMEITEQNDALEASEVVESSGSMKHPLMEIVEEQMAEEALAAQAPTPAQKEESSAVNLGGPVDTHKLNREEMDALLASQEMGSAAEPSAESKTEPEKPDARKTRIAGRGPIRTTQMQEGGMEDVMEEFSEVVEEPAAASGDVVEAGDVVEEPVAPVESEAPVEEVVFDSSAVGEDASEIILRSDHPTVDSSEHLGELAGAGPHSGMLLDKLKGKHEAEVDPEEVQLGEAAREEEEAPAAVGSGEKSSKPPKSRSSGLMLVGATVLALLIGAGAGLGAHFLGLLPGSSALKQELEQQKTKLANLETSRATENQNAQAKLAALEASLADEKKAAETTKTTLDKALDDEKKNSDQLKTANGALMTAKQKADADLEAANKAAGKLAADKKTAEDTVIARDKTIGELKNTVTTLNKDNEKLTADKKTADAALKTEKANAAKLAGDLKTQTELTKNITDQLVKAKFVDANADGPHLLQALNSTIALAQMKPADIQKLQQDYADTKATLKDRWEPKDMLATWLPVLESHASKDKDLADKALLDADRVLKDPKSKPEDKAKAQALLGLAKRNDDQFDDSKKLLEEAKKGIGANGPWLAAIDAALKEVSNPMATYKARVDTLRNKGDYDAALASLTKSIDALPAEKRGDLLAERSLLRLEALRAKNRGPLAADDPAVKAAQEDADKAAATGVPQGSYAVGRLAEELGHWPEAVDAYKKAVDATPPPLTAQSSRYRAALGNALLQSQGKAAPKDNKTGRLPALNGPADPQAMLAMLMALALQPPLLPSPSAEKANALADEIINAPPGTVPFDVLAQAYVIKGEFTKALKVYAEGLKTSKELKPDYADGLLRLIETHPLLKRSESRRLANPLNAEKHYGAGLRWYWERSYANAETEFLEAIANDGLDARYYYFLGLSRLAQNKPEAREDFAQGAKLEAQERPSRAAVSTALERVQGPMRATLNEARRQAP